MEKSWGYCKRRTNTQRREAQLQNFRTSENSWLQGILIDKSLPKSLHESESCSFVSNSLWPHRLYSPRDSPGQNTGVGSLSLLQGIFPTQGLNWGLLHCRQILYQLSHKGSPRILEWVAYPFSSRSSWSRNWTVVSCTAGRFFTNWAIREAYTYTETKLYPGANKFQCKTHYANSPANRNTTLNIKRWAAQSHTKHTDTPKLTTGPLLHSREKRSSSTHQNTDTSSHNQEHLTSHWSNPTHRKQTPYLRGTTTFQPAWRGSQTQ